MGEVKRLAEERGEKLARVCYFSLMEEEVNLHILDLAVGGEFVAEEIDAPSNSKVFVRRVISGEQIRARITATAKNFRRGELLEIVDASPSRTVPVCEHFGECGGCDLQHIEINAQRQLKLRAVRHTLERKLKGVQPEITLYDGKLSAYHYRARLKLHVDESGRIGFYRLGGKEIVEIKSCAVATENVNTILPPLREFKGEIGACFSRIYVDACEERPSCAFVRRSSAVAKSQVEGVLARLRERYPAIRWALRSSGGGGEGYPEGYFFQANLQGNEVLQQAVLKSVSNTEVVELYAGAGNFSIPLAENGCSVTAVELNRQLVRHGEKLLRQSGCGHAVQFVCGDAERFLSEFDGAGLGSAVTLLLDPPRTGAHKVVQQLQPGFFTEVVYVSCSLPTFVRDAAVIVENGYLLKNVLVLDMFPQTHHIELIGVFQRGGSA